MMKLTGAFQDYVNVHKNLLPFM